MSYDVTWVGELQPVSDSRIVCAPECDPPFEMFNIERWLLVEIAVSLQGPIQTIVHAS